MVGAAVDVVADAVDGAVGVHAGGVVTIVAGRTEPPPASPGVVIRPLRFGIGGVLSNAAGVIPEERLRLRDAQQKDPVLRRVPAVCLVFWVVHVMQPSGQDGPLLLRLES